MTTPVPQSLPKITSVTHPQYLLSSEVISLLQGALSLIEEMTPHLGDLYQKLSGVEHFWEHGEWGSSQVHEEEAEKVAVKQLQAMRMRLHLHTLLFGLGVENRPVRGQSGHFTEVSNNLKHGNLIAALELMTQMDSLHSVPDEEFEDFEDDSVNSHRDISLF